MHVHNNIIIMGKERLPKKNIHWRPTIILLITQLQASFFLMNVDKLTLPKAAAACKVLSVNWHIIWKIDHDDDKTIFHA